LQAYGEEPLSEKSFTKNLTVSQLVSATRIALPAFDPRELEKLIIAMISVDGPKWLPKSRPGTFLYLRFVSHP
jgi:hypothetical protein